MSYKIKVKQIDGAVGGDSNYNSEVPNGVVSTPLGGAPAQDASVWKTKTLSQVFDSLLFPYKSPVMTFSVSGNSTLEVGEQLSDILSFTWNSSNDSNVQANSVNITDVTGGSILLFSNQASDGTDYYTYGTAIFKTSVASHQWLAQGVNTNSSPYSATVTKSWYWRKYWGTNASGTATESLIESLSNSSLSSSNAGTYSMAAGNYKYFAFPVSNGVPTSFITAGLDLALADSSDGYTLGSGKITYKQVSVTNAYGQTTTYNVFRSKYTLAGSISVIVS
jgi:hypothetical protein